MKKIQLKDNKIPANTFNFLNAYLINLGIKPEDIDSFVKGPKEEDQDNPWLLENIASGIELMQNMIKNQKKIFLQVDSDVDGFTSSAIFYSYFKYRYPELEIVWRLHEGKEHGVLLETIPEDCDFIVIPDAGSMQLEEQQKLNEQGKKVLILDHHTVTETIALPNVVIINNQTSPQFKNKSLSGAGIVYLFIKAYDESYFKDSYIYEQFVDLAALGIISDAMDTRTLGNNYIIQKGLTHIRNKMFQELLKRQEYSIKDIFAPNKIDIAFYIAPLINGLIRSGSQDEKELLFSAMLDNQNVDFFESESRGNQRIESLYQQAARVAANAKSRQDAAKKRASMALNQKITKENLDKNKIIIIALNKIEGASISPTLTGLIAMDLVKNFNKPVLVLREIIEEDVVYYRGSGRSKDFDGLKSLLGFIRESGLADYAEGHGNAFGASFTTEGLKKFIEYSNEKLKDVDFSNETIEVDWWFKDYVNATMLREFAEHQNIYGAGIPQPKFAFSMTVHKDQVKLMGKGTSLNLYYGNLGFVLFKTAAQYMPQFLANEYSRINIVGRSQINSFMGKDSVQIIIDEIEIFEGLNPNKKNTILDLL